MRPRLSTSTAVLALGLTLGPGVAVAAGPRVSFTLPAENTPPPLFGSLPFPNDLYFDQGQQQDGDGTLLNAGLPSGSKMGLAVSTIMVNTATVEDAYDLMEGFGTSSAVYFFFEAAIDSASLPASPVLSPSLADSVFCADVDTLAPVPILLKADMDTRIPNVLAVLPLPGRPLRASTRYACVVRRSVTGAGEPVEPSFDWLSVRDGASANGDADEIFDPVVVKLGTVGVAAEDISGMTVFTTQATTDDVSTIRGEVLPELPLPTADFTSRPELVFDTPARVDALLGSVPHAHIAKVATGYFAVPQFQNGDANGGPTADQPVPPSFVSCFVPCETDDERFTYDALGRPAVLGMTNIPVTVVVPRGSAAPDGWPIVIQQHGLGGQRTRIMEYAEEAAARGFASIGIDIVAHGYRFFGCGPAASCSQDTANNFGGTASPDGFVDGTYLGSALNFLFTNLGFFQGFHNMLGVRDNLRQTIADLMSLVRVVHGGSLDAVLDTRLDGGRIFYMGHSLGAMVGAGFVPMEPELQASLLNAGGGGLANQLLKNSPLGVQTLVNGIFGLDPAHVADQFSFEANLVQAIVDPADPVNAASLFLTPVDGAPRNVVLVEAFGDQVVPNSSNEALAIATGVQIFDPFVQNLHQQALSLPVAPTRGFVSGNAAGGTATAVLLQNGPATHGDSLSTVPGTLLYVPEFARSEEFPITGAAFPRLIRPIRISNAGILDEVLDWFADVAVNGGPGIFAFDGVPNFNPIENIEAPSGTSTQRFFARLVSDGGAVPYEEDTPDVTIAFGINVIAGRVTAGRSILGVLAQAAEEDVPPGPESAVGTLGFLPFFVTLQQELGGVFLADVAVSYTEAELYAAGVEPGSAEESSLVLAAFHDGACTLGGALCSENGECGADGPCVGAGYTLLATTVDAAGHTATGSGVTAFGTFAVVHPDALAGGFRPAHLIPGGGTVTTDCRAEWVVMNPTNTPFFARDGRVNARQTCRDGDIECDADQTADGTCTFRVAVCFNGSDLEPRCAAGESPVASMKLLRPSPTNRNPELAANARGLLAALVAIGGEQSGSRLTVVDFAAPTSGATCTVLRSLRVAVGKTRVRTRAVTTSGRTDADRLILRCVP